MNQPTPPAEQPDSEEYQRWWWEGWIARGLFEEQRRREMDDES